MGFFGLDKSKKLRLPTEQEALPGRSQAVKVAPINCVLNTPQIGPFPENLEKVYFGMGCFWGAEKLFWSVPGVFTTAVGYGAGYTPNPTYQEVCTGQTGHNELVMVVFDPKKLPLEDLLQHFWQGHNPTEGMKQGNDIGTQYRSGIYPTTDQQLATVQRSKRRYDHLLAESGFGPSTTEIRCPIQFYYAEDYHQQYLAKNPTGYCPNHTCEATGLPAFNMTP